MMRKTYTILAVALTTTACGGAASEATAHPMTRQELAQELSNVSLEHALENREHFAPLCDADGYPLAGNINNKSTGATVSQFCQAIEPKLETTPAPTQVPAPTPPAPACDLDTLNKDLSENYLLEGALAQPQHFRCLCDDQGYPLVGNINAKGTTASAFCGALKERGLL